MSGRASKWVFIVVLPLVLALFVSYPLTEKTKSVVQLTEKRALTDDEASEHGVSKGGWYVADSEPTRYFTLPSMSLPVTERTVETADENTRIVRERTYLPGRVKRGLDIAGGSELYYRLRPRGEKTLTEASAREVLDVLRKRIDPDNIKEYVLQAVGEDRLLIAVPGATPAEIARLKSRLEKMGELEFRLVLTAEAAGGELISTMKAENNQPGDILLDEANDVYYRVWLDPNIVENNRNLPEGQTPEDARILVSEEVELTGASLAGAYPTKDQNAAPAVGFRFDPLGSRKFADLTGRHTGWRLAIILDGSLQSAPVINDRIDGPGIIQGRFSPAEMHELVNVLKAGSLPIDIELLQENTVGPTLGSESIRKGVVSLLIAGLLVLGFIAVYYMLCGLVADAALLLNLVLLIGVMALLDAALTLPGMAGILLTVGMAVDANVLIFERIREEWAAGKEIRLALRNGYERALTTIVDANVTTLLTALILYLVGTGPVKGFAITLSVGLLISMFTALVVTRLAFETFIEKGWMKGFKMFQAVKSPAINFSAIRKVAYVGSIAVVLVGTIAFFSRGAALYDIDFTGGSLARISLADPMTTDEVRQLLASEGFEQVDVQGLREAGEETNRYRNFTVRVKGTEAEKLRDEYLPLAADMLVKAGIIKDPAGLVLRTDNRTLDLTATSAVSESQIRAALKTGDSIYDLVGRIDMIVPVSGGDEAEEDIDAYSTSDFKLRVPAGDAGPGPAFWLRAVLAVQKGLYDEGGALHMQDVGVTELTAAEDGRSARLVLGAPLDERVLRTELVRIDPDFEAIAVKAEGDSAYTLTGQADLIERFVETGGAPLERVPNVRIDGEELQFSLVSPKPERHIRTQLELQGLSDFNIVPLDVTASRWELLVSAEQIRQEMLDAFADRVRPSVGVSFLEGSTSGRIEMILDEEKTLEQVKSYLSTAGLGTRVDEMLEASETVDPKEPRKQWSLYVGTEDSEAIKSRIREAFANPISRFMQIGASVADEMKGRALMAVLFASVIIVFYVAVRFHAFRFGVAAVIALLHDVLITAGLVALADMAGVFGDLKISLASLAAFLTIIGYSLNDTIVVFDRIRENMVSLGRREVDAEIIDMSINQTLSRTLLTSLTTLMVVVVLYLFGGSVLEGLAFTLIIGVIVGTYSSMFIASPLLLDWARWRRTHGK